MSRATGLPERSLVADVLTGIAPGRRIPLIDGRQANLPGLMSVSISSQFQTLAHVIPNVPITRSVFVIEVDGRDATDRVLRLAHRRITELKRRLKKASTERGAL